MKRALVLSLVLVGIIGAVGLSQGCCCCPPPPERPPCYTSFWVGEPIEIGLRVPFCFCYCNCCETPQVLGWHVETWSDGTLVYSVALDAPTSPTDFSAIWDQTDSSGAQVAAGYYKVVVSTTTGDYEAYLKLVERPQGCCFWPWLSSWPCSISVCQPRVTLSRTCTSPCQIKLFVSPCCP
jgi:hypothetical protein